MISLIKRKRLSSILGLSLDGSRLEVAVSGRGAPGSRVKVTARYGPPTGVPLVGEVVRGLRLEASATMRVER